MQPIAAERTRAKPVESEQPSEAEQPSKLAKQSNQTKLGEAKHTVKLSDRAHSAPPSGHSAMLGGVWHLVSGTRHLAVLGRARRCSAGLEGDFGTQRRLGALGGALGPPAVLGALSLAALEDKVPALAIGFVP